LYIFTLAHEAFVVSALFIKQSLVDDVDHMGYYEQGNK